MKMRYYAVRPKSMPDQIRIEKARSPREAQAQAFGRTLNSNLPNWEAKDLGSRVSVIQSDRKRIALLRDPAGWEPLA